MHTSMTANLAAALALLGTSSAHLIMQSPSPYGGDSLDNSPLTAGNFPCKLKGDPATFYKKDGISNPPVKVGETQKLSFKGSASHGGGSCQLALTKDPQPSKSSSWQVILSIEGGCPVKDGGQGTSEYEWKVPEGIEPGDYTFAWTWISKLAGQPEYYMNCAPITVAGGASKRSSAEDALGDDDHLDGNNGTMHALDARQDAAAFPELFVANLADINSCKTEPGTDPEYPDPGKNVEKLNPSKAKYGKVTGDNCVPVGKKQGASTGGGDASSGGGESSTGGSESSSGGSSESSGGGAAPSSTSAAAAAPSSSGFATSTSAAAVVATSSAASAGGSGSTGGGASPSGGESGACTTEGQFNCDGTAYQQCASGKWTSMMALPGGTKCQQGQSTSLWRRDGALLIRGRDVGEFPQ